MASLLRPLSLLSRRTREHENEHQSQEIIKIHFYSGGKGFVRDCLLVSQATQQFGSQADNLPQEVLWFLALPLAK